MTDTGCREILSRNRLPEPDVGELVDVRWSARDDDWYIETVEGKVFWLDSRTKVWKYCPNGALR